MGGSLLVSVRATLLRWANHVPALFRHDPLFRYAAIAAGLALIFLAVSMVQDGRRHDAVTGAGTAAGIPFTAPDRAGQDKAPPSGGSQTAEPPVPEPSGASSSSENAQPLKIAPGHPLEDADVAPAPHDSFGTMPKKGSR